jgi:restriction system protein
MAIPTYTELMLPALEALASGNDMSSAQVRDAIGTALHLSAAELNEPLPNSPQPKFANRVHWALFYLRGARIVERVRRGVYRIAPRGREVLRERPVITVDYLERFPEFAEWRAASTGSASQPAVPLERQSSETASPDEQLVQAAAVLRRHVEDELLSRIMERSPAFFERLVVRLIGAMGYGDGAAAGQHLGASGDGGVDGVIWEDKLQLDAIYLQAKRYDPSRNVPARDIRDFIGALEAARSKRGVFITTASGFSQDSVELLERIEKKIALINGRRLVALMFEHDVGVREKSKFVVKEIDEDTFLEEL